MKLLIHCFKFISGNIRRVRVQFIQQAEKGSVQSFVPVNRLYIVLIYYRNDLIKNADFFIYVNCFAVGGRPHRSHCKQKYDSNSANSQISVLMIHFYHNVLCKMFPGQISLQYSQRQEQLQTKVNHCPDSHGIKHGLWRVQDRLPVFSPPFTFIYCPGIKASSHPQSHTVK